MAHKERRFNTSFCSVEAAFTLRNTRERFESSLAFESNVRQLDDFTKVFSRLRKSSLMSL